MTITEQNRKTSLSKNGNGTIRFLKQRDVLVGRGGESNHHVGNHLYQKVIVGYSRDYAKCSRRKEKTDLSWQILHELTCQGFRFLKKDKASGRYSRVGDEDIRKKISQRLRERALEATQDERDHRKSAASSSDENSASSTVGIVKSKEEETTTHNKIMSMQQVLLKHPLPGPPTGADDREQDYEPLDMRTAVLEEGLDAMLECWAQDFVAFDMPTAPPSDHCIPTFADSSGIYHVAHQQEQPLQPTPFGRGYVSFDEGDLNLAWDGTIEHFDE